MVKRSRRPAMRLSNGCGEAEDEGQAGWLTECWPGGVGTWEERQEDEWKWMRMDADGGEERRRGDASPKRAGQY